MPVADVVVIGAGLAGLVAAARLAESGASVTLVAKGHASTHWASGAIDVAAPVGASTPAEGVRQLARDGHPYALLAQDVGPAVEWLLALLASEGLPLAGGLEAPIRRVPTAIGGTRRVAIVPEAQAGALAPWSPDEVLVVAGPARFKDFWPVAIADSLERPSVWAGSAGPSRARGVAVAVPDLAGRRNLNALHLAARFDDPATRRDDIERLAEAIASVARGRRGRVALPAMAGIHDHAAAWAELRAGLPLEPFEVPLVPPSVPGLRLYAALRAHIRSLGGRVQVGEAVARVRTEGDHVTAVELEAAARTHLIRTGALVLATGGLAGGGLVAHGDGSIVEPLLGLAVEAPKRDDWLRRDGLDPAGHPIEAAGIQTDDALRPVGRDGRPALTNVRVAGALLAGQRALLERCGDGVAVASGWRAAMELAGVTRASSDGAVAGTGAAEPVSSRSQA
jgi:glycerol-3-phosphate dehydrogenase subunit B